jgi:hypothetical protein
MWTFNTQATTTVLHTATVEADPGLRPIHWEPDDHDPISPRADRNLLDLAELKPLLQLEVGRVQQETLLHTHMSLTVYFIHN